MKLVSWNVENVVRCLPALSDVVGALGNPDLLCVQELRIRRQDEDAIRVLEGALPGYRCHYALARDPHNVTFRGGRMYGVATYARGRWRAEVPDWDREGRVVVLRRRGLSVINVYAVNGTGKPYFDETGRVEGDRHEYKRRFQSLVMDLGRVLCRDGGVIIAGDWNVSRTVLDTHPRLRTEEPHARARAELNERLMADGFIDIWRERHPDERAYTWFNRRARTLDAARVDYILVSTDIASRVRAADILDLMPCSDHAPVRLELDEVNAEQD
jgi:exodeoxyribonuclease III